MRSGMFGVMKIQLSSQFVADISILMMDHHRMTRLCSPGVFQKLSVEVLLFQAPRHLQIYPPIGSNPYPHGHKAAGVRVPLVGGPIAPVLLSLIVIEKGSELRLGPLTVTQRYCSFLLEPQNAQDTKSIKSITPRNQQVFPALAAHTRRRRPRRLGGILTTKPWLFLDVILTIKFICPRSPL